MSSSADFSAEAMPEPLPPDFYADLELEWYRGNLLPHLDWLLDFVRRHRSDILAATGEGSDDRALLTATKKFILDCGSVHMAGELQHQLADLQREFWYRGEKGDHDRARIQQEWVATHAEPWRRHLLRQYQFVTEKGAEEIFAILRPETGERF